MNFLSTENARNAPVFIWGEDKSHGESGKELFEKIKERTSKDFNLLTFEVSDWNSEFSPWFSPAVFGKEDFKGDGKKTLDFILENVVPEIKEKFPESRIYLAGYSLAAFFSLWALYESDGFDGAVCASPSLWFPDWEKYALCHKLKRTEAIYMSLGKREEKTKNRSMAKVGEMARMEEALLQKDEMIGRFLFEWNEGGHFDEPLARLSKGIAWILS